MIRLMLYYNHKEKKEEPKMENFDKRMLKMNPEELQQYLAFKRKGSKVPAKKGKGSYSRKNFKKEVA